MSRNLQKQSSIISGRGVSPTPSKAGMELQARRISSRSTSNVKAQDVPKSGRGNGAESGVKPSPGGGKRKNMNIQIDVPQKSPRRSIVHYGTESFGPNMQGKVVE